MNILLQILDEGKITDSHGRNVSFENTVIIMTSNAGSERKEGALGFAKTQNEVNKDKAMKALSEFLRPEFIGRVDEIAVFNDLTKADFKKISVLMLSELIESMQDKGIKFEWTDEVTEKLAELVGDKNGRGARDLRNVIRRNVEDKIANIMVERCDSPLSSVSLSVENDAIKVEAV